MSFLRQLNRKYLLRYRLEYVVALVVVYGMRCLSPSYAWRVARSMGRVLWVLGARRTVILANLDVAFPEMTPQQRLVVGRKCMEHFCCMVVDIIFQTRLLSRKNLYDHIKMDPWVRNYFAEHGEEGLRRRARRILFLTAHIGNWELATGLFCLLGVKISPVFRSPSNPFLARLLRRIRLDSQSEFIERRGAVETMIEHFDQGKNVGLLFDQEAMYGIYVPFFGHPACTHKTPAVLVRDHKVRVFFGVLVRKGDYIDYEARGELIEYDVSTDDRSADLEKITTDLMRRLEPLVREYPEQYLWTHRRWKRVGVHGSQLAAGHST